MYPTAWYVVPLVSTSSVPAGFEPGAATPHEALYFFKQGAVGLEAVRSGPWKYRLNEKSLYNLDKDLGEKTDVAAANPEVVARMLKLVQKMDADLGVTKNGPG